MTYDGYKVEPLGSRAVWVIRSMRQGQTPKALHGEYTSQQLATAAVDSYLRNNPSKRKGKQDAEVGTPSN